jgi:hypothetical protein
MISIPLSASPSQILSVTLSGGNYQINIYTLGEDNRLFFDIYNQGAPIITCVLCQDRVKLIQLEYLGFPGDLAFIDTQGTDNPIYTGLGSRFLLVYLP